MKIFTFVSLLFMPPTLIASIFGMNVHLPIFGNLADFAMVMLIMFIAVGIVLIFFKMKKML
jgi:magnesium transporter